MGNGKKINLDQLLEEQAQAFALRVTVEPIAGNDERVKVTPHLGAGPCLCNESLSLEIPKTAIDSVRTTDQTHACCGKVLMVVELGFKEPAWSDALAQLVSRAPSMTGGGVGPFPEPWGAGPSPGTGPLGGPLVPNGYYCLGGQLYQYLCSHLTGGCWLSPVGRSCHLVIPDQPPSRWWNEPWSR